jgi:glutathione S-transferase
VNYVTNTVLGPALGRPLNLKAAAEAEKVLSSSLSKLENIWLNGDGRFLLGSFQPSIADLSLVCELTQLEVTKHDSLIVDVISEASNSSPVVSE